MPTVTNQTDTTLVITHKGGKSLKLAPNASVRILAMTDEIRSAEKHGLIAFESSVRKQAAPLPKPKPETKPEPEPPHPGDDAAVDRKIAEMIEAGESRRFICDALNVPLSRIRKVIDKGE